MSLHSHVICQFLQAAVRSKHTCMQRYSGQEMDHIQPSHKRQHWLPICQRVDIKITQLTCAVCYSSDPQHSNSLLMDQQDHYSLPKNSYLANHKPLTKLSSTSWVFIIAILKLWNTLTSDVKNTKRISILENLKPTCTAGLWILSSSHIFFAFDSLNILFDVCNKWR